MQPKDSGGLDKRTLIAFALMAVVWVVFVQFMPKSTPSSETTPATETVSGETGNDRDLTGDSPTTIPDRTDPAEQPGSAGGQSPQQRGELSSDVGGATGHFANRLEGDDREIVIEGEHYRAVFAARGGVLRSWALKDFTDTQGELVELVQDFPGALGLHIQAPAGDLDLSDAIFSVEERSAGPDGNLREIRFVAEATDDYLYPALRVERVYRLDPARYDLDMEVQVSGISNFRRDHHLSIAWDRGLPSVDHKIARYGETKEAVALLADNLVKDGFGGAGFGCGGGCSGDKTADTEESYEGMVRWAGVKGKYFAGLLIPSEPLEATFHTRTVASRTEAGMRLMMPLEYEGSTRFDFRLYCGPLDHAIIKNLDKELQVNLGRVENMGPKLLRPVAVAIHWFLVNGHKVIPNYGVVILLLALVVRIIFHPLNVRALRSQQKMQALKPKLDEINEKYKDDPQTKTKRTMELHKSEGINPMGGCLPMLPQMPVFFALYSVMMNAIELRHAPFVLWVSDLASPDKVGDIAGIPIHILPILMGAAQYLQSKSMPTDPKQAPMMMMMPLIMVFFLYSLPSGLVLYWTATSLVTWAQQKMTKAPVPVAAPTNNGGDEAKSPKQKRRGKKS